MSFEIVVKHPAVFVDHGTVEVRLRCPRCGAENLTRVPNRRWNMFQCPSCRFVKSQYLHACSATIDSVTGRVGQATVEPYQFDWDEFGLWAKCLGEGKERRIPVCLQIVQRGLKRRSMRLRYTACREDDGRIIATDEAVWEPCICPVPACPHNRLIWWLPPTDIWELNTLQCEVMLSLDDACVFQRRLVVDIAPPVVKEPDACDESSSSEPVDVPAITDDRSEAEVVNRFHRLYYYGSPGESQVWTRTFWMNVPCMQCPLDLWVYQEILAEVRPDLVVETGTLFGGNALFLAQMLDRLGNGRVVTIDPWTIPRPVHPRIQYVAGSSTDVALVRRLLEDRPGEKCLVILDSNHDKDHVSAEIKLFAPYVSLGSYLIVTDSNINGHPVFVKFGPGPYEAIADFLHENDEFVVDREREKFKLTFNPGGYLKRVQVTSQKGRI